MDCKIKQYLHFGYLPEPGDEPLLTDRLQFNRRNSLAELPEADLIALGVESLKGALAREYAATRSRDRHIVPLSGGLDSRAILAGLLEQTESSKITAVVFGLPGTWDFEIGQQVAKTAGVRCEKIDLTEVTWNQKELIAEAARVACPLPLFEVFLFSRMIKFFPDASLYWSGFMGDPLSGSHLLSPESETWRQARVRFWAREQFATSMYLNPTDFNPAAALPEKAWVDPKFLSLDEQLDFNLRQGKYIKPLVLFESQPARTPFLQPDWVNFILGLPHRWRHGQYLYKKILQKSYPGLFSLPTKTNFGLPLGASRWRLSARKGGLKLRAAGRKFLRLRQSDFSPRLNYIDFDAALRSRADLKAVVYENLMDLKQRQIVDWIDIDTIWQRHQGKKGNYADALTLLASLEIILKVKSM